MNFSPAFKPKVLIKSYGWFIGIVSLFFILFFVAQNFNHRFWMHDFEVYYSAAKAFVHGDQVYGLPFGLSSGYYKYSPFALLIFVPLGILPFYVARVLQFIALSVLIVVNIILCMKMVGSTFFAATPDKKTNLKLFIIFLPLLANIYTELHLGNINTLLLFIFLLGLQTLLSGKQLIPGLLLAIGILIKPHFLIFLPLLLLRKKFRCLGYSLGGIATGLLLPAIFTGWGANIELHKQWLAIMQMHNNSLIGGQNTLYSWVYRYGVQFFFPEAARYDKVFGLVVLIVVALAVLALIIYHFRRENSRNVLQGLKDRNFIFEYFILLAIVPNITVTDSEHFLFSLPLIAYIVNFLFVKGGNTGYKIVGICCLVMYGMNMRDIIGKDFSAVLTSVGILGLANFLIIVFCVIIHTRQIKRS